MKKRFFCILVFMFGGMVSDIAFAQTAGNQTCVNFSDSYGKVVLKKSEPTPQDVNEILSVMAMVTGYAAALQDVFQGRLVGWDPKEDETALLKDIYKYCLRSPHHSLDRAMRSISQFVDTFKAIQQQEDNRCFNYIFKNKTRICPPPPEVGKLIAE